MVSVIQGSDGDEESNWYWKFLSKAAPRKMMVNILEFK